MPFRTLSSLCASITRLGMWTVNTRTFLIPIRSRVETNMDLPAKMFKREANVVGFYFAYTYLLCS